MSDFKWTDELVEKFARIYCGNPTKGFNAEDFHGLKMEEKMHKFKEDVLMEQMRKDVILSTSTESLRNELQQRGYAVGHGCVWQSNDVVPFDPTNSLREDERMHIMSRVLNSDWLTEQIMSMIEDEVVAYKNEEQ